MKTHNFILGPVDTDSISICKPDMSEFSKKEQNDLLEEINNLMPKLIKYAHDGYFKTCIVLKAKNYILEDESGKIKIRGSGLKDQKKEPALIEMSNEIIKCLLSDNLDHVVNIYIKYIKESLNVNDIKRWSTKKTITKAILNCAKDPNARLNERKIYEAVKDIPGLQEGNKVYLYPVIIGEEIIPGEISAKTGKKLKDKKVIITGLKLAEKWEHDEDKEKLMERVIANINIFNNVLDNNEFIDYSLVKNKKLLETL